jgi:hypothetical protein
MARKTTTTTPPTPTRTPRKPAKASQVAQDGKKGTTGQGRPSGRKAKGTAEGKVNPFDTIAKMAADGAGTADLTAQLQASIDQAKKGSTAKVIADAKLRLAEAHRAGKHPSNRVPSCPICVLPAQERGKATAKADGAKAKPAPKATGNGKTFAGRPTNNPATVAARAKEAGLRVRKDADIAAVASRLRATESAVSAWLDSRDGSKSANAASQAKSAPTAKATTANAKSTTTTAKPKHEAKAPAKLAVTLRHPWVDREPDYLRGHVLRFTYTVDPNTGHVTSQLHAIEGPDGNVLPDRGRDLPLDFRPAVETLGNGRKVVLRDRTIAGLTAWLQTQGLTEQQ